MKVLHISTSDISGGAAIAAYRLHDGLRRSGVRSRMLVSSRASDDQDVVAVERETSRLQRIRRRLDTARLNVAMAPYRSTISPELDYFSDDRVAGADPFRHGLPQAEIVNLHWVARFIDYRRFFARLSPDTPMVWTLHDMNPLTGGCHYSFGCTRFIESCGACPQLGSRDNKDLTARILARKLEAFRRRRPENTRIVAPSQWLASEAARSTVLNWLDVAVIPYGLDTEEFRPRDRYFAREVFGLPQDQPVILFVADSLGNHRKGFDLLTEAMRGLPQTPKVTLAAIGGARHGEVLAGGAIALGRISSHRLMSFAYSAADLFVLPTRADNLPNVAMEAMACGTPVVGFNVGGVPDMVRSGQTGLLAPPEDVGTLRQSILTMLGDRELRERIARTCRAVAVSEYGLGVQASRYSALYDSLIHYT